MQQQQTLLSSSPSPTQQPHNQQAQQRQTSSFASTPETLSGGKSSIPIPGPVSVATLNAMYEQTMALAAQLQQQQQQHRQRDLEQHVQEHISLTAPKTNQIVVPPRNPNYIYTSPEAAIAAAYAAAQTAAPPSLASTGSPSSIPPTLPPISTSAANATDPPPMTNDVATAANEITDANNIALSRNENPSIDNDITTNETATKTNNNAKESINVTGNRPKAPSTSLIVPPPPPKPTPGVLSSGLTGSAASMQAEQIYQALMSTVASKKGSLKYSPSKVSQYTKSRTQPQQDTQQPPTPPRGFNVPTANTTNHGTMIQQNPAVAKWVAQIASINPDDFEMDSSRSTVSDFAFMANSARRYSVTSAFERLSDVDVSDSVSVVALRNEMMAAYQRGVLTDSQMMMMQMQQMQIMQIPFQVGVGGMPAPIAGAPQMVSFLPTTHIPFYMQPEQQQPGGQQQLSPLSQAAVPYQMVDPSALAILQAQQQQQTQIIPPVPQLPSQYLQQQAQLAQQVESSSNPTAVALAPAPPTVATVAGTPNNTFAMLAPATAAAAYPIFYQPFYPPPHPQAPYNPLYNIFMHQPYGAQNATLPPVTNMEAPITNPASLDSALNVAPAAEPLQASATQPPPPPHAIDDEEAEAIAMVTATAARAAARAARLSMHFASLQRPSTTRSNASNGNLSNDPVSPITFSGGPKSPFEGINKNNRSSAGIGTAGNRKTYYLEGDELERVLIATSRLSSVTSSGAGGLNSNSNLNEQSTGSGAETSGSSNTNTGASNGGENSSSGVGVDRTSSRFSRPRSLRNSWVRRGSFDGGNSEINKVAGPGTVIPFATSTVAGIMPEVVTFIWTSRFCEYHENIW
jgi:hypothetical protein